MAEAGDPPDYFRTTHDPPPAGRFPGARRVSLISPSLLVSAILILAVSQLLYAFWPYPRRAYLPVLILTTAGILLGQLWDLVGLPSLRVGSANLLPALIFAVALQPLAHRLPIRLR